MHFALIEQILYIAVKKFLDFTIFYAYSEFCSETPLTTKSIVSVGTKISLGDRKSGSKLNYRVEADLLASIEKARVVSFCTVNTSDLSQ